VDDARCAALKKEGMLRREKGSRRKKNLFDSIGDLCLVADITRIKRSVIVPLNDVKDGYRVTARKQRIYDVAAEETTAADDEERVAGWGEHMMVVRLNAQMVSLILSFSSLEWVAIT
jgi:hypothetical protein